MNEWIRDWSGADPGTDRHPCARSSIDESRRLLESRSGNNHGRLPNRLFEGLHFVGLFPGNFGIAFAEVAIIGGLRINRPKQVELLDDGCGFETKDLANSPFDLLITHFTRPESIHADRNRIGVT